ncbi:MAG TPA: hypothetical protein VIV61_05310 [Candidatus Ozemobacteraceae bacterium]
MNRQGTVILMLLVALMIGGIVAMRLIPGIEIQEQRQKNAQLKMTLGQIRQAFAMRAAASANYNPDLSSPNAIASELSNLAELDYLYDPTQADRHIPGHRWGTGTSDVYWKAASNIAENTSFEVADTSGMIASWQIEAQTTLTRDWFYLSTTEVDDFPGENKLGITLGLSGRSLRIDR